MCDRDKRNRGPNFSLEEELELVQNVYVYRHIIESRESDSIARTKKDAAWLKIMHNFNLKYPPRKVEGLRCKYENLKTLAKKYRAAKLKNEHILNSFPNSLLKPNTLLDMVISLMEIRAQGHHVHGLDDITVTPVKIKQEREESDVPPINLAKPQTPNDNTNNNISNNLQITAEPVTSPESNEMRVEWSNSPPLIEPPRDLTITPVKNDNYYKIKTEYIKKKILSIEKEYDDRVIRMKMEQEQHELKMKILKLELSIKEREFMKLQNIF